MLNRVMLAALAVGLATSAARADILIDDFALPNPRVTYAIGPDANPTVITTNLGGGLTRQITLTVTNPSPPGLNGLTGGVGTPGGLFAASFDVLSQGTVEVVYTYATAQNFVPTGVAGALRFRAAGDPGFAPDIPLNMQLVTATGIKTFNGALPLVPALTDVDVPLTGVGGFAGPGDLTQVTSLRITLTGGQAADFIFDAIGITTPPPPPPVDPVPAPPAAVLALMAVPALGLWRAVRRKKAAA